LTLAVAASAVHADTVLDLTDTVTFNGTSYVVNPSGLASSTITGANSLSLGDAFNNGTNLSTGSNFNSQATGSGSPWNFQDDYVFNVTGSTTVQVAAISFGSTPSNPGGSYTGLTDLQARLIGASGNAAPTVGAPVGGTLIDAWSNFSFNGVNEVDSLPTGVGAGTYILQIRGEAASPASYGGTITFTPVPLPSTALLMLSGLGGMGLLTRRRRPQQD
jgi:hypothetical protein